eukprot:TRINITY_DN38895_c0_g1_i1.p2 TRINITY_DN38895_c0_g1~~TRINITY_DN38895_c0_g1_i1.p2  ORF type:complete len:246 (-),score=25.95 TRINITY_DN38895_c0_g1_i1:226-963(-)
MSLFEELWSPEARAAAVAELQQRYRPEVAAARRRHHAAHAAEYHRTGYDPLKAKSPRRLDDEELAGHLQRVTRRRPIKAPTYSWQSLPSVRRTPVEVEETLTALKRREEVRKIRLQKREAALYPVAPAVTLSPAGMRALGERLCDGALRRKALLAAAAEKARTQPLSEKHPAAGRQPADAPASERASPAGLPDASEPAADAGVITSSSSQEQAGLAGGSRPGSATARSDGGGRNAVTLPPLSDAS